jgi:hypothetical protein
MSLNLQITLPIVSRYITQAFGMMSRRMPFGRLEGMIINMLSEEIKINQTVFQTRRPQVYRNKTAIVADTKYRGVSVLVPQSKYVSFYLREVYVYASGPATTTLKFFDLNDGQELIESVEVTLVEGLNTIPVDETFSLVKFGGLNFLYCN